MKTTRAYNSTRAGLPDAVEQGKPFRIQLAPKGQYPQWVDDPDAPGGRREIVQMLDDESIASLVGNFADKVLVDADHSSETGGTTAAMGWVTRLYADPEKGLMAEIEPTPEGAEKINGKVYRFVSGAWTLGDDGRPVELVSVGLTNRPNLPVAPMINAQSQTGVEDGPGADNGGRTADSPDSSKGGGSVSKAQEDPGSGRGDVSVPEKGTPDSSGGTEGKDKMERLKEILALAPEATDEEVYAAVEALVARSGGMDEVVNTLGLEPTATNEEVQEALNAVIGQCGELQAANEEANKARLNAEAEKLVADNEDVIPEDMADEVKAEYAEDPEAAKATVANMRRVYERAVLNAAKAAKVATPGAQVRRVVNSAEAKVPVAINMSIALKECGGDPAKENEMLARMYSGK